MYMVHSDYSHSPVFNLSPSPPYKSLSTFTYFSFVLGPTKFDQSCLCSQEFRTIHWRLLGSQWVHD